MDVEISNMCSYPTRVESFFSSLKGKGRVTISDVKPDRQTFQFVSTKMSEMKPYCDDILYAHRYKIKQNAYNYYKKITDDQPPVRACIHKSDDTNTLTKDEIIEVLRKAASGPIMNERHLHFRPIITNNDIDIAAIKIDDEPEPNINNNPIESITIGPDTSNHRIPISSDPTTAITDANIQDHWVDGLKPIDQPVVRPINNKTTIKLIDEYIKREEYEMNESIKCIETLGQDIEWKQAEIESNQSSIEISTHTINILNDLKSKLKINNLP